jgi:hypothetical protein
MLRIRTRSFQELWADRIRITFQDPEPVSNISTFHNTIKYGIRSILADDYFIHAAALKCNFSHSLVLGSDPGRDLDLEWSERPNAE